MSSLKVFIPVCLSLLSIAFAKEPVSLEDEYIDKRIKALEEHLANDHLLEMKESVEGQGLMIADWDKYAEELKKVRKLEDKDLQIHLEIEKLKELKARLNQKNQQPPAS